MKLGLSKTCYMFFSTLSNPTRLAILELLREGSKNVTDMAKELNQEQSMISHNLQPLEKCGFVFKERRRKERIYSLNKETMEPLFKIFTYHADKYCDMRGKCLTTKLLKKRKKEQAAKSLRLNRL